LPHILFAGAAHSPAKGAVVMGRTLSFLYGLAAYLLFLAAFTYAIGFVSGVAVPKTIDTGPVVPLTEAIVINLLLLTVFALQHSIMARKPFKRWLTKFIPASIERSTYVLFATLALILILAHWRPIPTVVWHISDPTLAMIVLGVSFFGWGLLLLATFLINHFELFGLHQVIVNMKGRNMPEPHFKTPVLYKVVRHPIYLGFIIAFWAAPTMTVGHLLFAAVTTAYIFVGIWLEERDLVEQFGDQYRRYRRQVGMLIPSRRKSHEGGALAAGTPLPDNK
jgi:protein-S-isoprenylcysteine O-methyltransferase Ste14